MNGLQYIRTLCNLSQSFLAQKLGVSRQAINLWEQRTSPLPQKRLAQLEDFFGVDQRYFGTINEKSLHEINNSGAYHHKEGDKEYYCFKIHKEFCTCPECQIILGRCCVDGTVITSADSILASQKQKYKEILQEAENLIPASSIYDQIIMTQRMAELYGILTETLQSIPQAQNRLRTFPMYQVLKDIFAALSLAYGIICAEDIDSPSSDDIGEEQADTYLDRAWRNHLAILMRTRLQQAVSARENELHISDAWKHGFPDIPAEFQNAPPQI